MVSSSNKTDRHDITDILLKVALNTINQANQPDMKNKQYHTIMSGTLSFISDRPNICKTSKYIDQSENSY
jgi:hypothetical protein